MRNVEVIECSWAEFEGYAFEKWRIEIEGISGTVNQPVFRGQADAKWGLDNTLERYLKQRDMNSKVSWKQYDRYMNSCVTSLSSLVNRSFDIVTPAQDGYHELFEGTIRFPPHFELMVYLRHHGFPSPLLDWSRSPFVAAHFAFKDAFHDNYVAIWRYQEYIGAGKVYTPSKPHIIQHGSYVAAHPRHHMQQAEYTSCSVWREDGTRYYASMEDVRFEQEQDRLVQFKIPARERRDVIERLNYMNINDYSLFGNEDALAQYLAYKEIERQEDRFRPRKPPSETS